MKKLFTIFAAVLLTATMWAQSPERISYQAVIRNSSDALVISAQIGMQIKILKGSATGTVVYTEIQTPTTSANGLVSIEIGGGTVVSGDFSTINWANGPYFIKTETDITGGASYTITGTSQILSVPYALHAKTAETLAGGITNLTIGQAYQGGIIFWLDATGQHGLIAATEDQSTGIRWQHISGGNIFIVQNAIRDGIGAGMYNTERAGSSPAAQICANYQGGGYGDWYLPSLDELILLIQQMVAVGGFAGGNYWSSTEIAGDENSYSWAWMVNTNGFVDSGYKPFLYRVRAIRAF